LNPLPELPNIEVPEGMNNETKDSDRYKLIKDSRRRREQIEKTKGAQQNASTLLAEQDELGRAALHVAVIWDWEHICASILRQLAKVDSVDHAGDTALILAAATGNQPIVESLLAFSPTLTMENKAEKTAVDLAKTRGIRRLLQKFMIEEAIPKPPPPSKKELDREEKASRSSSFDEPIIYRVRIEGLSKMSLPDMLETQVRSLIAKMLVPETQRPVVPAQLRIVGDPITERPLGYAYVDFWEPEHANLVASYQALTIAAPRGEGSSNVRLVGEGPRNWNYNPPS